MPMIVAKKVKKFTKCTMIERGDGSKCKHQCGLCKMFQYREDGLPGLPFFYDILNDKGNIIPSPNKQINHE